MVFIVRTFILVRTVIFGRRLKNVHFWEDAHGRSFMEGRSWPVIFVRTVMDGHFSKDVHGRLFLVGRSSTLIFGRTLMVFIFSRTLMDVHL